MAHFNWEETKLVELATMLLLCLACWPLALGLAAVNAVGRVLFTVGYAKSDEDRVGGFFLASFATKAAVSSLLCVCLLAVHLGDSVAEGPP